MSWIQDGPGTFHDHRPGCLTCRPLEAGRHADPVDQADAILQVENLRIRAQALCDQQDGWFLRGQRFVTWDEAALWMGQAWDLLSEVARA